MTERVTVVIPTYDRPNLVGRAIESVLQQTFEDLKCVVVDDHSPGDATRRRVTSITDDRLTYIRHEENHGLSVARNTGIEHADGEFVAFLDDDDEWLPEKLERQVALFETLSDDYGIVYCWMDYVDPDGRIKRKYRPTYDGYILPHVLDGQRIGAGSTLLVRTAVAHSVGGFDESLSRGIDGDFIRRVCRGYMVAYVPDTLVRYHVEHGHRRITREDPTGIRNAIHGKRTKLRKFPEELDMYPGRKANIFAGIAYHQSQLHQWDECVEYYRRALGTSLVSPSVYVKLARSGLLALDAVLTRLASMLPGRR